MDATDRAGGEVPATVGAVSAPVDAVLLDFHGTLLQVEEPLEWITGAAGDVGTALQPGEAERLVDVLLSAGRPGGPQPVSVPEHLGEAYARRDLSEAEHRAAYVGLLSTVELPHPELADALYARLLRPECWVAYPDSVPVVRRLHEAGLTTVVLSNIGWDIRPALDHHGLLPHVDEVVLSYEVGVAKPDAEIFELACEQAGVPPERCLMVGDTASDAGAALAGIRTLLLPTSDPGRPHGLDAVLALLGLRAD